MAKNGFFKKIFDFLLAFSGPKCYDRKRGLGPVLILLYCYIANGLEVLTEKSDWGRTCKELVLSYTS